MTLSSGVLSLLVASSFPCSCSSDIRAPKWTSDGGRFDDGTRGLAVRAERCPEEADELACDGGDDLRRHLAARNEALAASGEPALLFVGNRDDATRSALLP